MNNDEIQQVRLRMKERRLSLGLTYQSLAEKTGISKSTLQRYENGSINNLSVDKLEDLAKGLETTSDYLMGWKPAKSHDPSVITSMESSSYTGNVKDQFAFHDSVGNIVNLNQGIREMLNRDKDWTSVVLRASKELSNEDLQLLKGLTKKYLELTTKR